VADSGVAKVIQLVGSSEKSFSDAVRAAVAQASKTIRGITGVDVVSSQADVSDGEISTYRVTVNIAFGIESDEDVNEARQARPAAPLTSFGGVARPLASVGPPCQRSTPSPAPPWIAPRSTGPTRAG
jgi:dodecin